MEDALAGVKAYLTASLEAQLAAIEATRSVTIPRWKIMETHEVTDRQYPMIEITPQRVSYEYGDVDAPLTEEVARYEVAVVISQVGSDPENVQEDLLRYVEAVVALTFADDTYGSRFTWVKVDEADFSEMVENQETGQMLQLVGVQLQIKQVA